MSDKKLSQASFSELMDELNQLESAIEERELDDLDKLMSEVERAEEIIDELRSRLKKAEEKINQADSDE